MPDEFKGVDDYEHIVFSTTKKPVVTPGSEVKPRETPLREVVMRLPPAHSAIPEYAELLERVTRVRTLTERDVVVQACVEEASREIRGLVEDNDVDVDDGPQIERIVRDQILRALDHMSLECSNLFDVAARYEGVFVDLKGSADIDWLELDPKGIESMVRGWSCKFCNNRSVNPEELEHDDECPIAIARVVHEKNKES
ncbi:hypothetical protein LCGC14_0163510 [marine sediment metagenome]|uniref:Uncharacterized protein n=1 Tax=marine sediment metagenome TaxID=412755 RepID=A0A0F9VAA7_9ZZZZ